MSIPFQMRNGGAISAGRTYSAPLANSASLASPSIPVSPYPINPNEGQMGLPIRGVGNPSVSRPNMPPSSTFVPPTPVSDFKSAAVPTTATPVPETIPNTPRPQGVGSQIAGNVAASVAFSAGTASGAALSNTVTGGNSAGFGSGLGGGIGGIIGGIVGGGLSGAATGGTGSVVGGLAGSAIGSAVGSFLGGLVDNAFGKKNTAVTSSGSTNTSPASTASATSGGVAGEIYTIHFKASSPASGTNLPALTSDRVLENVKAPFSAFVSNAIEYTQSGVGIWRVYLDSDTPAKRAVLMFGHADASTPITIEKFQVLSINGTPASVATNPNPNASPSGAYTPSFTPYVDRYGEGAKLQFDFYNGAPDTPPPLAKPKLAPRENVKPFAEPPKNPNVAPNALGNKAPASTASGAPTATGKPENPFANGGSPSFVAKPFISGVSNPSEAYDPVDVATGLTRSEFEQRKQQDVDERRARQDAPAIAAANYDAKRMEDQFKQLSNVPRSDLGGLSPQQYQRNQYAKSIEGDKIRTDAYERVANPTSSPTTTTATTTRPARNPTGASNPAPDLNAISLGIVGLGVATGAALTGIDYLKNKADAIASNTTPTAQQTNAKQGVCDAMQPDACGFQGVQAATAPIKDKVIENGGLLAGIGTTLASMIATLGTILANFTKLFTFLDINAKVEAVKSTLTLALTLHNALMLSQSLGDTLGLIVDNVLNVFGNTFRSTDGTQISTSQHLGSNVQQWIINVIGVENYVKLNDVFATANRIYQTGMNIVSTVQSILDSAASVAQATGINVAKIGNALRDESVVSPRAYKHMDDTALGNRPTTLSRFTQLTTTISDADDKAQNLVIITGAPIQIKDAVKQSKDDIKAFNDARDDNSVDAKRARDAKLEEIKALKPLSEATVGKRDDDT